MAKLSAHGKEIGRVFFTTSAKAYFEDGKILKNHGFGWKLAGSIKTGLTPQSAYDSQVATQRQWIIDNPEAYAYRKALHNVAGMCNRWKLHAAIQMMPEDCDGVWSECCDGYGDNVSADVDEVAELCRLYLIALDAQKEKRHLETA